MSRKATMKDNFSKRSTKKDKKKNTENKYGKYTTKYVRIVESTKKDEISYSRSNRNTSNKTTKRKRR